MTRRRYKAPAKVTGPRTTLTINSSDHTLEWLKWWTDYADKYYRVRPTKTQEASEFILHMSGPAADRLAKKYYSDKRLAKPISQPRY